ncbi:MAG: SEC-C domain-containing protein [Planctomycetaceae bacterium]|jgi:tetratricopeptide (TPR) repeat protein|nr:SEC-C domain-containing protein [Planctomycetaceae bacterium]
MSIFDVDTMREVLLAPLLKNLDKFEREVHELRASIKKGFVNKRCELLDKLCDILFLKSNIQQFDEAKEIIAEIVEIGKSLAADGSTEDLEMCGIKIGKNISMAWLFPIMTNVDYDKIEEMFDLYDQWMKLLPENEINKTDNDLIYDNYRFSDYLLKKGKKEQALKLTIETLNTFETKYYPTSTKVADWQPLTVGYNTLAKIYEELGDNENALQNYLKYDEIADKVHDMMVWNKTDNTVQIEDINKNVEEINKIFKGVIIINASSDLSGFSLNDVDFDEERNTVMLRLGDIYAQKSNIDEALKYYNKAARTAKLAIDNAVSSSHESVPEIQFSKIYIAIRKIRLYMKINDWENARKQIQNAAKEFNFKSQKHDSLGYTEKEVMDSLYDEIKNLQQELEKITNNKTNIFFEKENVFGKKQSGAEDRFGIFSGNIKWNELRLTLGEKHNEACKLLGRGHFELSRGRFKSAIVYLLQARNVLDSLFISLELVSSRANVAMIYSMLGRAYLKLHDFAKAEKWSNKAVEEVDSIIKKTNELANKSHRDAREQFEYKLLMPVDCGTTLLLTLETAASLYISTNRFDNAIKTLTRLHEVSKEWHQKQQSSNTKRTAKELRSRYNWCVTAMTTIDVIRGIEECCCHLGRFDEAIKWVTTEVNEYYELCYFLSANDNKISTTFRSMADFSTAALLVCTKQFGQADAMIQKIAQRFVKNKIEDKIESALDRVELFVALRRCMLMSEIEFSEERNKLIEARKLMLHQRGKAIELFNEVLGKLEEKRKKAENSHNVIRKQWDLLIKYTRTALNWSNGNTKDWDALLTKREKMTNRLSLLESDDKEFDLELVLSRQYDGNIEFDKVAEWEPDNIDDEIAKHDLDFEGPFDNPVAPEYDILKEGTSAERHEAIESFRKIMTSQDIREGVERLQNKHTVGRNDPCPCGSGKKYKKCCMNKDT